MSISGTQSVYLNHYTIVMTQIHMTRVITDKHMHAHSVFVGFIALKGQLFNDISLSLISEILTQSE